MTEFKKIIASIAAALVSLSVTIPVLAAATLHPYDVNGDGNVSMADYTVLTMLLDGYKPLSYDKYDVTNNGVVSYADAATIFDYYRYGSSASSASVANFNALTPPTADIASIYNSITYLKRNCSTGTITEYTLNTNGDEAASTVSPKWSTPMELDPNETAVVKIKFLDHPDYKGSGTIIDNHIIATAAHNLYDAEEGYSDIAIQVIGEQNQVLNTITPSYIHLPKMYTVDNGSNSNDYALIYVDEDLSQYGMFEIGLALDSFVTDTTGEYSVKVSGFPGNMPEDARYVSEGSVYAEANIIGETGLVKPDLFNYYTNTSTGDSGGPAYIEETYEINGVEYNCKTMIGIHISGLHFGSTNFGWSRRITADQLRFYRANTNLN